jgi:F0F1-type ATP synthase delta subunit
MAMNALDSRGSNQHFAKARVNLPLRFYNKPGLLASRLYVEAEKSGKKEVDSVATALATLKNELTAHPRLAAYLSNAAKTPQQKSALFKSLSTSLKLPPTLSRFLDYMAKYRTAKELTKVIGNYQSLVQARDKIVDVTITLAEPNQPKPGNKELAELLKYSPDTNIRLKVVVDPAIEGGAILSSKDRFLDRSFRKATSAFKEKLELAAQKKRAQKRAEFMKELAAFPDSIQP